MKTKAEQLFEDFLTGNSLGFEKIKEASTPRPDYYVLLGELKLVFELKELAEDDNFGMMKDPQHPHIKSNSRTVGEHIRRRIERSKRQVRYGAEQSLPSVLLIYNSLDPVFQAFGTETHDFIAAMYGEYTIMLNPHTKTASEWFNGRNQMLQVEKNTSFSAIGHLCDSGGTTTVRLFQNVFAKVRVPFEALPACFDVQKIEVSFEPLTLP